jgi:O-acetylserine/cysteine efflux transporter
LAPRDLALAVAVAALWGLSFIATKIGVAQAPPLFLTALRYVLVCLPAIFFTPRPKVRLVDLAGYGICICCGQMGLLFVAIGNGMPSGLASLVIHTQVPFTIALAWLVLGQKARPGQIVGALIAFSGLALIGFLRGDAAPFWPFVGVVAAAAFLSVGNMFSIRAGRTDVFSFIVWSSLFGLIPLVPLSLALEDHVAIWRALSQPSLAVWGSAAFLAYAPTILGFGGWAWLLSRYPAAQVTPFALLVPVFGFSAAAFAFGEKLPIGLGFGAVVVMAGLAITVFAGRAR